METKLLKTRTILYLAILYGFLLVGWLLAVLLPESYNQTAFLALWGSFSLLPVLATFLTRAITHDQSPWYLKPNFRQIWKTYLFAALAPGVAIFLSGLLYFLFFPQDLDLTARNLVTRYGQFGAPETLLLTPQIIILIGFAFIFISPLVLPVHLFALGEEIGWRGYECRRGKMHLNTDWVLFEPVDENYNPVVPGQFSSRVLITNLANRVMPIICYELGDRVSLDPEPCGCGITLPVVNVEGRTDDVLRFESSNGQTIPVLPLALWAIIKEAPGILRFQAIQTASDVLKIRLEPQQAGGEAETWDQVEARAREYLQKQGLGNVTILRAPEPPMRDPKSGKFRSVWAEKG